MTIPSRRRFCIAMLALSALPWSAKSYSMTQPTLNSNASELLQQTLTPALFARHVSKGRWKMAPHLAQLDRALTDAISTGGRLIITMPPRHGKSELTSKYLPAWFLGTFPDSRIIMIGYGSDFAKEWGRKARDILEEHGRLFGVSVSKSSAAAEHWSIEGRLGEMYATGVGGSLTGRGANLLIVDDPIKNSEEANSPTYRRKVHELFQSAAYTRLEPGAAVILIQTRWHPDDLAGRLLRESGVDGGDEWTLINLPAIAGIDDPLGRQAGEALWPERYDLARLAKIRKAVGSYFWTSLFQQNPIDEGRNQIKREWIRHWSMRQPFAEPSSRYIDLLGADGQVERRIVEAEFMRAITVDCAASSDDVRKERRGRPASLSVISFWLYHRDTGTLVWRDCWSGRWGFPELQASARRGYADFKPDWLGIEWEKTGIALLQSLGDLNTRKLSHENKGKLERFASAANMMEQGKVYIPRDMPCGQEIESELLQWDGDNDTPFDRGDTLAYAAIEFRESAEQTDTIIGGLVGKGIGTYGVRFGGGGLMGW